jgi:hypothetical protein
LFAFSLTLGVILENSPATAQEKSSDHNTDYRTRGRMRNKPCEQLKPDNENKHCNYGKAIPTKDEKCQDTRDHRDRNGESNGDRGVDRVVLKVLLCSNITIQDAACAGPVVDKVLNPGEQPREQTDDSICNRR